MNEVIGLRRDSQMHHSNTMTIYKYDGIILQLFLKYYRNSYGCAITGYTVNDVIGYRSC
jgi:hypothetical protein